MKQGSGELVDRIIPVLMSVFGCIAFFNVISSFVFNEPSGLAELKIHRQAQSLCTRSGFSCGKKANLMNYQASQKG